jgi:hypothetical protein
MIRYFFVGIILCFSLSVFGQDIKLSASVDRNPVDLDDQITYQLEVSGSSQNLPEPSLPDFGKFTILGGPSVSSSYQIINFNVKASKTFTYILGPQQVGSYTIPPAIAEFKGKKYQSNEIRITVVKRRPGAQSKQRTGSASDDLSNSVFFKAVPSKRSVYVNEQVNISYKIYFRANIRNPEFIKLPETVGFWVEEYPINKDIPITQEVVNGVQYNVAVIKKLALFPTKSGELTISPMQLKVDVVVQQRRRDPFSLFDDFFDSPFGRVVPKQLATTAVKINAKALPDQGKPVGFTGLVGDFRLSTNLDKTTLQANEALSFKVKINGSGNLKVLNVVPIELPSSFEVFDPKTKDNVDRNGTYLSESKEFEYVMIPRIAGEHKIKPVQIAYFDPFQERYKALKSKEYVINVLPGKNIPGSIATSYMAKEDVRLLGKDISFIKEEKPDLVVMDFSPFETIWFWLAIFFPAIVTAGAYGYRRHLEKISTNLEYARKRKAHKQARYQLRRATQSLKDNNVTEFFGEISSALVGYVADKTNRSGTGLVRDDVEEILKSRNVDPELISVYIRCLGLDEADFKRFAQVQSNKDEAEKFYNRAEQILIKLEKYL